VSYTLADDAVGQCGVVKPGCVINVPCDAVYTPPFEIRFVPCIDRCVNLLIFSVAVIAAVLPTLLTLYSLQHLLKLCLPRVHFGYLVCPAWAPGPEE